MIYQNNAEFAESLDRQDPLRNFRQIFYMPKHKGEEAIYFCGNSLGLQPKWVRGHVNKVLETWQELGVEGFFQGTEPWLNYQKDMIPVLAGIVGAKDDEVCIMNSLTVNLHLMLVSFYKPAGKRFKILVEGGAFPSDQYAFETQVKFHGYDPKDAIIEVCPREGEYTLRTDDILKVIEEHKDELALVLFGGINYFTGQLYDMETISAAAHKAGAKVGFDLAHAIGNVPMKLHDWQVDFAVWCSYKYMNSGPGGIGGLFVHEKHFSDKSLNRFAGWWGYKEEDRFLMSKGFVPEAGAAGWQLSTSHMLLLATHRAGLEIFQKAGGVEPLRKKSILLTGFLEFVVNDINRKGKEHFRIITPQNEEERGSQLSIICSGKAKEIFKFISEKELIGDWREPNVIRLSPVPLYNSFKEVFEAGQILLDAIEEN